MKPIIFSTPMVQAILAGKKTQTRRVIKPQPDGIGEPGKLPYKHKSIGAIRDGKLTVISHPDGEPNKRFIDVINPKYQPGDILWVRETWQSFFPEEVTEKHQRGARSFSGIPAETAKGHYMYFYYRADGELGNAGRKARWLPSIFMPKAAARIFLRVNGVRVERVQEISHDDAVAEGVRIGIGGMPYFSNIDAYRSVWDDLNAKRGYGWDKNPWVWVIEFERVASQ